MKSALVGNFPAKLEFEDDSFELTVAELSKNGSFRCKVKTTLPAGIERFRMALMDEDILSEFECNIVENRDGLIFGNLSPLSS